MSERAAKLLRRWERKTGNKLTRPQRKMLMKQNETAKLRTKLFAALRKDIA